MHETILNFPGCEHHPTTMLPFVTRIGMVLAKARPSDVLEAVMNDLGGDTLRSIDACLPRNICASFPRRI